MSFPYKLGRLAPTYNRRVVRSALAMAKALDPLGPPPATCYSYIAAVDNAVHGDWGEMGNNQVGDCTFADCAHQVMLHTANTGNILIPSTQLVLAAYSACTGYEPGDPSTDRGATEYSVCQYMEETGLMGQKSVGFGYIDPTNLAHIKWCNLIFGACRLGVNLPQSAMDQFGRGEPWDVGGDETILGGHDVPVVYYDPEFVYVVTWGRLQKITPAWMAKFCEEAHAELYPDWVTSQGTSPSNLDMATLESVLKEIAAAE